jgi:hypothetical protein
MVRRGAWRKRLGEGRSSPIGRGIAIDCGPIWNHSKLRRAAILARGSLHRAAIHSVNEAPMRETSSNSGVSRRSVLIAAAGAAPLIALTGREAQAKLAMTAVKYQTEPGKDGHQCDGCNFFVAPNSCKLVDGDIAPTGWCTLWVKKPAA